jgi:hypothetical protein
MLIPGLCADGEMMCSESASASEPVKYFDIASPAFGVVEPQEPESDIVFPGFCLVALRSGKIGEWGPDCVISRSEGKAPYNRYLGQTNERSGKWETKDDSGREHRGIRNKEVYGSEEVRRGGGRGRQTGLG